MPPVFAPQEPLDPGVNAGIGYQERQDKNYQQWLQGAAVGQRQQALDQHAYEYGNEPYRRQQDLQDRLAYEAQHVKQEYTINDEMDKQRLDNARADLDSRVRNGELLPEDAAPAYKDLEQPTWLLQRKKALSDQEKEKAQVEALKRQNEHQATADATYQTFMAKAGINGITTIPDPDNPEDVLRDRATGEPLHFQWDHRQGRMAPLEKPASSARVPSHAGWTDKQIDDAAHTRAVQSRPDWQSNPKAAKAHPEYVDVYSQHRSAILQKLYEGETTPPDEYGQRKQKGANGEWKPVEDSKAAIAAAKPQKPEKPKVFDPVAERNKAEATVRALNPKWAGDHAKAKEDPDFGRAVTDEFLNRHANFVISQQKPGADDGGARTPATPSGPTLPPDSEALKLPEAQKQVHAQLGQLWDKGNAMNTPEGDQLMAAAYLVRMAMSRWGNIANVPPADRARVDEAVRRVQEHTQGDEQ